MPVKSALIPGEKVSKDDPRLFNISDLATILGVDRGYITLMKKCGFKLPGNRATVAMVLDFLKDNPDLSRKKASPDESQMVA